MDTGDPASVTCTMLKGDLPVDIAWLHNNRTITKNDGISIIHGKKFSMLNIEVVSFEHAGEYTCIVRNQAGFATYSAVLNVNGINLIIAFLHCFACLSVKHHISHSSPTPDYSL